MLVESQYERNFIMNEYIIDQRISMQVLHIYVNRNTSEEICQRIKRK